MYKSEQIFAEILRILYPKNFGGDIIMLHKIFYDLRNNFPDIMDCFLFEKRINPFCVTLDELLFNFRLVGILRLSMVDHRFFLIDQERLKKYPKNNKLFNLVKGFKELQKLGAS